MRNIKKYIASGVLALLTLATASGCGGGDDKKYLNFYVWGDNTEVSWYEKIAADFKAETGIEVKVNTTTGNYYDNLNILLGSKNNAPDIFFTEQGEILSQLATNRLLNLSTSIQNGKLDVKSTSNTDGKIELWSLNDVYRYDGKNLGQGDYYAFIKDWSPDFMMWYNKSHIDAYNEANNYTQEDEEYMEYPSATVPMTWSEFIDMSYKLTVRDGSFVRYGTMLDRVPFKHLMEFIQMTGSSTFDINGKYFNKDDAGVKKAFEFFSELQKGDKASSPVVGPTGIGSGEAFANGNLSIAWFGSWAYSAYHWENVAFEIGIAPPPVPDKTTPVTEEDRYGVSSGMVALAVNGNTKMKDEAVSFLNYYMDKGQKFFATKGFNLPGNKLVAESDLYLYPEDSMLAKINQYFYDFALNHTHPLDYNKHISQITVENIFDKHLSTYYNNYNPNNLNLILNDIANDIKNEID